LLTIQFLVISTVAAINSEMSQYTVINHLFWNFSI